MLTCCFTCAGYLQMQSVLDDDIARVGSDRGRFSISFSTTDVTCSIFAAPHELVGDVAARAIGVSQKELSEVVLGGHTMDQHTSLGENGIEDGARLEAPPGMLTASVTVALARS